MNVSARNKLKIGLLAIPFWLAVAAAPQAFAQDARSEDEEWVFNDRELDDLIRRIEEEDDGDNDVPTRVRKPKVQAKRLTGWGAKEALRWTINKQAFIEGYLEQAVGELRDPYLTPSSKSEGGLTGNYLWNGFTLNGGFFFTRNYSGTFNTDNVIRDTTYNLGAARKFNLSKDLTLTPSVKYTKLSSSTATKDLKKSDASLPFSYALNKEWTLKALTVAYSTQSSPISRRVGADHAPDGVES